MRKKLGFFLWPPSLRFGPMSSQMAVTEDWDQNVGRTGSSLSSELCDASSSLFMSVLSVWSEEGRYDTYSFCSKINSKNGVIYTFKSKYLI